MLATVAALTISLCSCGGSPPPPAKPAKAPAPAEPVMPEPAPPLPKPVAVQLEAGEAAAQLGADAPKLTQLEQLAPKTHEALLKSYLWKPVAECDDAKLVPVQPAPGLFIPGQGEPPKVRAEVYELLKQAGEVARQRGTSIEVLAGAETVAEAVQRWNLAALDAALEAAKAAPAAERKEKSQMGAAKKRLDPEANPRSWGVEACKSGRLAGFGVEVQLVALDASGGRGKVLVKGGAEADHFEQESYEATYWNKAKGKGYRQLTEIMSAGKFVRVCSVASRFTAMPELDGTWRCREEGESWEPSNRPLPPWK